MFAWRDRTIGVRATQKQAGVWLRVTAEHRDWAHGEMWTGNSDAVVLAGVAKPTVLARTEWQEPPVCVYGEIMTLAPSPVCSPTPELRADVSLPERWWTDLKRSLASLQRQHSGRVHYSERNLKRCLETRFGRWVDLGTAIEWATAHGDLHWANLTCPELTILDWECWGAAPAGIDAATLYCHSLLVPRVAEKVRLAFADALDTAAGKLAQLCVIDHLLTRAADREHPDLVLPLHDPADRLLHREPGGARCT